MSKKTELIVALDVDNLKDAEHLVKSLYPTIKIFKVGSQLFTACGPEAVKMVVNKGAGVFLDLKFHDIPHTVYQSVSAGTAGAVMMTVHILGGKKMLQEAVRGAQDKAAELKIKKPFIIGVTRLTSDSSENDTQTKVLEAARLAKDAGLDGVVCSVHEALSVKKECGNDLLIVTPGIRPRGFPSDDQLRVATPKEAAEAGVDFIVVGRPVIKAKDPLGAAKEIIEEISKRS